MTVRNRCAGPPPVYVPPQPDLEVVFEVFEAHAARVGHILDRIIRAEGFVSYERTPVFWARPPATRFAVTVRMGTVAEEKVRNWLTTVQDRRWMPERYDQCDFDALGRSRREPVALEPEWE